MKTFEIRQAYWDWREHPLGEFFVRHFGITEQQVAEFEQCIDAATNERPIQAFLKANPIILVQHLRASGRFVLHRKRLGTEFESDFIIGEHHSYGYDWQVVELESPRFPLFTKKGDPPNSGLAGMASAQPELREPAT